MVRIKAVVVVAALAALLGAASQAFAAKRVALVIGNDRYQNVPSLQKAVNDARTIGQTLRSLGFSVTVAEDLTQRRMSEQLVAFDRTVEAGDVAVFFFAGHGFEIKGENFLLPIDVPAAAEGQEELVRDTAFAAQRIIDRLQARGARTAILVLDACRNNPFERPGRTRGIAGAGGLAAMSGVNEGVFIIFSAGAKQTALDRLADGDASPNSVFTRNFVKELATPGLTLVQIAKRTQADVRQMALSVRHEQTPAYYDQIVGDVVLNGKAADAPPTAAAPLPQVAALPPPAPRAPAQASGEPINGPMANFMRSNTGWSVTLSFIDPVTAISWRLGESGAFKETGFLDAFDPRTRRRMPNPSIELDADTPNSTLYVRYADAGGEWVGPFPIRFEPTAALERGQRKILEMTAGSWLALREFNGLLLYYTHLVSYRCAIREVRIGIDSAVPDKVLALPSCDEKNPNAIPSNVNPYMKLAPTVRAVSVELTYRDGTRSEIKTFRR
jgi:uncharacterized caspase-like protein